MTETKIRPPVVVVLGHVDHGKTTLLDYIRKTNKAGKEVGGITQSIGAYVAKVASEGYGVDSITFIDTPGHEAFASLRARGAKLADIAILVVDGNDSVKPQTRESIAVLKVAGIPYLIAINKMDKEGASTEKVKKDLMKEGVALEEYGGNIVAIPISAKTGKGVQDLLEAILLVSSSRNFSYSEGADPEIYVLEVNFTKAGPTVYAIIKNGQLKVGDPVFAGETETKVRALLDDNGVRLQRVLPSQPFVLLGFKELPPVGSQITTSKVITDEVTPSEKITSKEALFPDIKKQLNIVVKADSQGSLEAILNKLDKNENIALIYSGVGEISKSDVFLAKLSKAILVGFGSSINKEILLLADQEKVLIKTYKIIYELLEELTEVSDLIASAEAKKKSVKGEAKIKAIFNIAEAVIAGVEVVLGKMTVGDKIELYREGKLLYEDFIVSIKQQAKSVPEIKKTQDGGIALQSNVDFKQGDVIKSYSI